MLNNIVLVGRIVNDLEIKENENGVKQVNMVLAIPRNFKNANGEYETDFIPVVIYKGIAENVSEYCKKGDIVGIKGRIQMQDNNIQIISEKVTFLSSKKADE